MASHKQQYWIDNLKAFGIFLVVFGHCSTYSNYLVQNYIYSFHMPLFFFASGYLQSKEKLQDAYPIFLKYQVRSLLVPYLLWGLITYLLWSLKNMYIIHMPEINYRPLFGMIYGVSGQKKWLAHNVVLWFFPCLFVIRMLFYWLHRFSSNSAVLAGQVIGTVVLGHLLNHYATVRMPWSLDVAMISLSFFFAGYFIKSAKQADKTFGTGYLALLLLVFFFIHIALVRINGRVDLNSAILGQPLIFQISAFFGIATWYIVAILFRKNYFLSMVGKNTLILFVLNSSVYFLLKNIEAHLVASAAVNSIFLNLVYTAVIIAAILPFSLLISARVPLLSGGRVNHSSMPLSS